MDPTGVSGAVVSIAVNGLFELLKSAIHCKEKCKELEDLLDQALVYLNDLKLEESAAQGSLISPPLEAWLKALQATVEKARSPVLQCQSSNVLSILRRAKIARKIDKCSKRIREHLDQGQKIVSLAVFHEVKKEPSTSTSDVVPKEEQHFVPPEDEVFGMEKTLQEVVSNLFKESNKKWVGVYGDGGAGKTLLAKQVSTDSRVVSHFDQVLWVTFGQSCQEEAKQKELAQQINPSRSSGEQISNETLKRELHGKRCLLILDDVWEDGYLDLFDVVQQANGSRIFITTRIPGVLERKGATKTHLALLGKEDSMKLFMLHAFPNQIDAMSEVQEEVKQVVGKCGGLPLLLKVIGRTMVGREDWDSVLGKLHDLSLDEDQVLKRLKLGYDALARHHIPGIQCARHGFQQHFLYFAAYPEDWKISFWELFRCWKGEGLVANTADAINVLETLQNYALITEKKLVKWVHEEGDLYAEKAYSIHDVLLALALKILNTDGPKCYLKAGQRDACLEDACSNDFKRISLMWCEIRELQTSNKNKATTCLLLDGNEIPALPSLSNFQNLKVLCLRKTNLVCLPNSIGKLKNLETLDLRGNYDLQRIPSSLENLSKLSYLDVQKCKKLQVFPVDALLKFSNLVFFDQRTTGIWKCKRLHHQLFKHEKCLGSKNGQLDLDVMFKALTKLEVLRLDISGLNVELPESISKLSQLKELCIKGGNMHIHGNFQMTKLEILRLQKVQNFPLDWDWSKFPSLVRLDFEFEYYGDDDIKVSRMKNLKFFRGCFNDLSCLTQENFPKLEELKLRECTKLIQPHIQLASLKNLNVYLCHSITNFSISCMPNLEVLLVESCEGVNVIHIWECVSLRGITICDLCSLSHFTLAGKFPQLHTLKLERNELSSVTLGAVEDGFPQLHTLLLERLSSVRLQEAQDVTNLEILSLQNVQNLPLHWDWSKFPRLVDLYFGLSGDDDIKVTRMENLKIFRGCFNDLSCLTQENFPKLEELELRECTKLIQVHIQLASLKKLSVFDCHSITNFSIPFLPNLELLRVESCNGVNVVDISECPSLREIQISFLPSLPHFTLAGKFPQLHALWLYRNERLSSVNLGAVEDAFSQLEILSFKLLENLEVMPHGVERLPLLQEISLQHCKKLKTLPSGDSEDSSFYPSLRYLDFRGTSISKAQLSQRLNNLKPRYAFWKLAEI